MEKSIIPLFVVMLVNVLAFSLMLPVLPVLIRDLGLPDSHYGMLVSSYFGSLLVGSFVMGKMADRFGKKRLLMLSNAGTLFGWVLMGISSLFSGYAAFLLLLASRLVDGFTGGNSSIVNSMASDIVDPSERTKYFGFLGSSFGIGFIIGPFAGGYLYEFSGIVGPAIFASMMTLVAMVIVHAMLDEPAPSIHMNIHIRGIVKPVVLRFFSSFVFSTFTTIFPLLVMDRFSLGAGSIGLLFVAIGMMSAINQGIVVAKIERTVGSRVSLVIGSVIMASGFVATYMSTSIAWLLAGNYLFNLGGMMFVPIIKSILSRSGPSGTMMGIDESTKALSRLLSPVVATYLYQMLGSASLLYSGIIGGMLLALLSLGM